MLHKALIFLALVFGGSAIAEPSHQAKLKFLDSARNAGTNSQLSAGKMGVSRVAAGRKRVSAQVEGGFNFICTESKEKSRHGWVIKPVACGAGGLEFDFCDELQDGGTCSGSGAFNRYAISDGDNVQEESYYFGVVCDEGAQPDPQAPAEPDQCTLTVRQGKSTYANAEDAKREGARKRSEMLASNRSLGKTGILHTNSEFKQAQTSQQDDVACRNQAAETFESSGGDVYNCDGELVGRFDLSQYSCQQECSQKSVSYSYQNKSCREPVQITQEQCTDEQPLEQCSGERNPRTEQCLDDRTFDVKVCRENRNITKEEVPQDPPPPPEDPDAPPPEPVYKYTPEPASNSCDDDEDMGEWSYSHDEDYVYDEESGYWVSRELIYIKDEEWTPRPCPGTDAEDRPDRRCHLEHTTCMDGGGDRNISGEGGTGTFYRSCWLQQRQYECYDNDTIEDGCAPPPSYGGNDCELKETVCHETDENFPPHPVYGYCRAWDSYYACEPERTVCSGSQSGAYCEARGEKECSNEINGNCYAWRETTWCRDQPRTYCNEEPECTFVEEECVNGGGQNCTEVKQTFECATEHPTCSQTAQVCGGEVRQTETQGNNFGAVAGELAKIDAILDEMEKEFNGDSLEWFEGERKYCDDPIADGWATNNCCSKSVNDEGDYMFSSCSDDEVELARARRNGSALYIGSYCRDSVWGKCLEKRKEYCVYDSMLSRIINAEGKKQLREVYASNEGNPQTRSVNFQQYNANPSTGTWHSAGFSGKGRLYFYRPQQSCSVDYTGTPTNTQDCDFGGGVWMASCTGSNCGALPSNPFGGSGNTQWVMVQYPLYPEGGQSVSAGKDYNVAGDCQNGACSFSASYFPLAMGGRRLRVGGSAVWPLFDDNRGYEPEGFVIGGHEFLFYHMGLNDPMPASLPVRVRPIGGSWVNRTMPTTISSPLEIVSGVWMQGKCDEASSHCSFDVSSYGKATNRREFRRIKRCKTKWGRKRCKYENKFDCGGFSQAEFALLDFSRMDLTEYSESIAPDSGDATEDAIIVEADSQITGRTQPGSGEVSGSSREHLFIIEPDTGIAPWTTKIIFSREIMGKNGEQTRAVRAEIDWGNGDNSTRSLGSSIGSRTVTHTYDESDGEERDFVIVVSVEYDDEVVRTAKARVASYTDHAPKNETAYGGGQGGEICAETSAEQAYQGNDTCETKENLGVDDSDDDIDGDGVPNGADNCREQHNPGQEDANYNGVGDACE